MFNESPAGLKREAAGIYPVQSVTYHDGQVNYLQMLLGDLEMH